jgi:hypothetical protein
LRFSSIPQDDFEKAEGVISLLHTLNHFVWIGYDLYWAEETGRLHWGLFVDGSSGMEGEAFLFW